ncbi:Sugar transporter SWEET1 [Pseudolycoriella hygida]|uniref:Sugar transporter SWEET n=1 Tax=Pseudolycoriella hygida TaxID=35572 RepID=A0A9Q0MSW8_9DIPT|nr:Sugar transporter SWEET1 [Pseudolycoriella hygida]
MEQISTLLQPYKAIIGDIAGIVTALQMLSGAFLCNDIRKKGSATEFSSIPFLGGLILTVLSFKYATILNDLAMLRVNAFGLALNIIYMLVYYFYTPNENKTSVWAQVGLSGAFSAVVIGYAQYEHPDLIEFRFGIIMTVFLFALVGSPFLSLGDVIRKKSTEGLPFPIIFSGTVVSFMWFLYGLCLNNSIIVYQNVVLLIMSAIQLSLFVIYPSTPKAKTAKSKAKKTN